MENVLSQEAMGFQSDKLFKEMVKILTASRGQSLGVGTSDFCNLPAVRQMNELLKKETGVQYRVLFGTEHGEDLGPFMYMPAINRNHIFYGQIISKKIFQEVDLHKLFDHLAENKIQGCVNLKTGMVSGAFSLIPVEIYVPRDYFRGGLMTPEEAAAVILHECGHGWTQFEMMARMLSTNESLLALAQARQNPEFEKEKSFIMARIKDRHAMTDDEIELLTASKGGASDAVIIAAADLRWVNSELGHSVYDSVGTEYLADQWATRMGAGKALVTGLDKLHRFYRSGWEHSWVGSVWRFIYQTFLFMLITVATAGGALILIVPHIFNTIQAVSRERSHEDKYSRFTRIRHQNTEHLKDRTLPKELRESLIEDNEAIDQVMKAYKDNLTFLEKVAYITRPAYRKSRKNEVWQKELEALAYNKLFDHAAAFAA